MGLTADLSRFVAETDTSQVPGEATDRALGAVIDTLGCAIGGSDDPVTEIARRYTAVAAGAPEATVWGTTIRTTAAEAAFVNAIAGHALDYDDSLPSLRGHPSVPLCAAGFAAAEGRNVSGPEFLAAFVLGLEVAGRIGRALGHGHYQRGWHITATAGTFSSAAMAGRIMGLTADQLRHAFGIAAAQAGGLVRNFGSMAKPFHAGHAAKSGYLAAWLAREGMTADMDILDGDGGFIATYGDAHSSTGVPSPGAPWEIFEPGIYVKRWPCCYANHRALAGILELAARPGVTAETIEEIAVGFLPDADKALVHKNPQTGLEAKFSIEYCAAAAIADGGVGLKSFTEDAVARPSVRVLMKKVRRFDMPGEGSFSGVFGYTDVEITAAGETHDLRVENTPGSPQAPMTPADRREKFLNCCDAALGEQVAAEFLDRLEGLKDSSDVADVLDSAAARTERGAA